MANTNSLNMDEAGIQTYSTTTGNLTGSATTQYNVLVGDTLNKLTNVAPSATSGVPLISSGSSANPAFGTAVVAGGGTGNTTFTAYSVVCAGTTATGAFQNVSGLGSSGQVLVSNGASALPSWQTAGGSGFYIRVSGPGGNPVATATYYLPVGATSTSITTSNGSTRIYMPITGTITHVYGNTKVSNAGSAESCTLALRLNDTTSTTIQTVSLNTTNLNSFDTTISLSVTAGDFIDVTFVSPNWGTPPLGLVVNISFKVS